MSILLGSYIFPAARVAVWERVEEIGGRDARVVRMKGIIDGHSTAALVEAALDELAAAASEDGLTALSIREGRRLWVRRKSFVREVSEAGAVGAYTLELEAPDVFEEAEDETELAWSISASGATRLVSNPGNTSAPLVIEIVAAADVTNPQISDGERSIVYEGVLLSGQTLEFDGQRQRATLEGADVTPYVTGSFPFAAPGNTTLTFTGTGAGISLNATVRFRARWW